jgi:hypothetical protein
MEQLKVYNYDAWVASWFTYDGIDDFISKLIHKKDNRLQNSIACFKWVPHDTTTSIFCTILILTDQCHSEWIEIFSVYQLYQIPDAIRIAKRVRELKEITAELKSTTNNRGMDKNNICFAKS